MKTFVVLIVALGVILVLPWAAIAASIDNSKHDLASGSSASIRATDTAEKCIFCHTPHRGDPASRRPLWNKSLTTQALTWTPSTTTRGTTLPTDVTSTALAGSQACLTCHDGTLALGSVLVYYDPSTGSSGTKSFTMTDSSTGRLTSGKLNSTSNAYLDPANMQKNHPVGVPLPGDVTGFTSFNNPPTQASAGVTVDAGGKVQCQSCHNPHLTTNAPFLRISNAGSALCLSCHN